MTIRTKLSELAIQSLNQAFGFAGFRAGQEEAVRSLLNRQDTVVLLPTGAGKSLCYQVPAVAAAKAGLGTTVVISPLISLMQDQVSGLVGRGIRAAALNSTQDWDTQKEIGRRYLRGELDLLYVSPERAVLKSFHRLLLRGKVAQIAIDEAHCLSQWGHDFRPEYMRLNELREHFDVPTIALTATATPRVIDEIVRHLQLSSPTIVRGDFSRPNLKFSVLHLRREAERIERLIEYLNSLGFRDRRSNDRAIIYCSTRKKTQKIAKVLKQHGFAAGHYHAGRTKLARERAQNAFDASRTRVLVATNAFGMGVDYPNVRLLVHFQAPGSVEAYYQEAGRAGRDGAASQCVMFFGAGDLVTQRRLFSLGAQTPSMLRRNEEALTHVEKYASGTICRQKFLCSFFTGKTDHDVCEKCDVCLFDDSVAVTVTKNISKIKTQTLSENDKQTIAEAVDSLTKPVGKTNLAKALRGSRAKTLHRGGLMNIPQHGALHHYSEDELVKAITEMLEAGILVKKGRKFPTVWLPNKPVRGQKESRPESSRRPKPRKSPSRKFSTTQLAREMENYRRRKARALKWKPYMVFQMKVILAVDERRPATLEELHKIPGLGAAKIDKFGADILDMVREYNAY